MEVLPAGWQAGSGDLVVDGAGGLLLPAYVDTHIHLDKVLIRDQLVEHDGTLRGAIEAIHAAKRDYDVEDVRRRARAVIESSVLTGTTRLRSHVDVDTIGGLVPSRACSPPPGTARTSPRCRSSPSRRKGSCATPARPSSWSRR